MGSNSLPPSPPGENPPRICLIPVWVSINRVFSKFYEYPRVLRISMDIHKIQKDLKVQILTKFKRAYGLKHVTN